jgi:aryl-alcohol dehydrogenase-like predicted oxidoreductase
LGYTYTADWKILAQSHEIKSHTLSTLQKQWRESVSWLDGHVDLYQIHSVTMESGVLDDRNVLDELARLKSKGAHIGLSLSGPDQTATLRKGLALNLDGLRLFETVQATWNLLEPSVDRNAMLRLAALTEPAHSYWATRKNLPWN